MSKGSRFIWAVSALDFSLAAAVVLVLAGYGYQWGWWSLSFAFSWLLPGTGVAAVIGLILAVVYGFVSRGHSSPVWTGIALVAVMLSLGVVGTLAYWANEAGKYPPIHDISTDIDHPPPFRDIVPLRAEASNDTTYGDEEKAAVQREHYPDIQPLYLEMEYGEAFDRALQAARQMPWEQVVAADRQEGRIEAVDKLPWFGFIDDVVIRVDTAETAGRSRIDVRSVSRIGRGDIGVNAHRIRRYLDRVRQ